MIVEIDRRELSAVASAVVFGLYVVVADRPDVPFALAAAFIALMIVWIAWQDLTTLSLPDGAIAGIFIVGASLRLADPFPDMAVECLWIALDVVLCGGVLFIVREAYYRWKGIDGLGFGDVKLACACAALLGTTSFAMALFIASAAGCLFALVTRLFKHWRPIDRLPFGTFLAPICGILWVFSEMRP